ncbi:hypothetical protein [Streptomyces sp. F001]|nr:hypothetical protein [Streptomyces sp. F001]
MNEEQEEQLLDREEVWEELLMPVLGLAGVEEEPIEPHIVRGID